ncbi:MAG: SufS family cysteine desulfurase [Gemmataceae bacterium]|nr:SufS family cysteine desulfurase [Gemmataceae bacterium]
MSVLPPAVTLPTPQATSAALDVERLRRDFPILAEQVHGKPLVYLDNSATAQKPCAVLDAVRRYYEHDNANVHRAVHVLSERATEDYEAARVKVQKFLGANCLREVIFTRGCTEAINLVASTFGRKHVGPGDEVVVTAREHHSNIVPWQMLCQEKGARLRVVPINDTGELRLEELERLLTPRVKMLALVHVSNALGTINPAKDIIDVAHSRGIPVLVDGAQAVPHLAVNVQALGCDFYAFSGHKVYAPTGIGALYGRPEHLELMPPWQGGGDMIRTVTFEKTTWNELPYKFEAGTPNIAGAVGLGAALDYVQAIGLENIAAHEEQLLRHATARLADIPGVRLIGTARHKAAVISFVVENPPLAALDVGTQLDLEGVAVRTGHHCCMPLMERFAIPGTARASFALYNTLDEVDAFADALRALVTRAAAKVCASVVATANTSPAEPVYPDAAADSPEEAAEEVIDLFDFLDDWNDRYQHLIELGEKLPEMPATYRTDTTRVHGCQSTVYLHVRRKPGTANVVEFLADSDAAIVRGELALLQKVFSGQRAIDVLGFDVQGFFHRLGLDRHLSPTRRNGLAEMVKRVRGFAASLAAAQ